MTVYATSHPVPEGLADRLYGRLDDVPHGEYHGRAPFGYGISTAGDPAAVPADVRAAATRNAPTKALFDPRESPVPWLIGLVLGVAVGNAHLNR